MHEGHLHLLLVEDRIEDETLLVHALRRARWTFSHRCARTLEEALQVAQDGTFDAALVDLSLPDAEGVDAVRQLTAVAPSLPIIVLTGVEDPHIWEAAFQAGAQDYVPKDDLDPSLLRRTLANAVQRQRMKVQLELLARRARTQEISLRTLLDDLADAVVVQDPRGVIQFANVAARATFGDDFQGRALELPAGDESVELLTCRGPRRFQVRATDTWWHGAEAVVLSLRDMTEHERAQELESRLAESDRLASIGRIAGGIAHEINNPAALVAANLELLREQFGAHELPPGALQMLDECSAAIRRIGAVVDDLRETSNVGEAELSDIDLNDIVDAACTLLRSPLRHRCMLIKHFESVPRIRGRRGELIQMVAAVLSNLMNSTTGHANLDISTGQRQDKVWVRIRCDADIDGRDIDRPFERRTLDHGSGLSLAMAREIARGHQGSIRADNDDFGTDIEIELPADRVNVRALTKPERSRNAPRYRRPRVLLIDDEVELLRAYARILARDYEVVTAENGLRALSILQEKATPFDAIVCDLMMPELDGQEFFRRLESLKLPTGNVIFATGGAFAEIARRFLDGIDNPVLYKPFRGADLRRAVQATIDDQDPQLALIH